MGATGIRRAGKKIILHRIKHPAYVYEKLSLQMFCEKKCDFKGPNAQKVISKLLSHKFPKLKENIAWYQSGRLDVLCHVMSRHIMSCQTCHLMSCHLTQVLPCLVTSCHVSLRLVSWCHVMVLSVPIAIRFTNVRM